MGRKEGRFPPGFYPAIQLWQSPCVTEITTVSTVQKGVEGTGSAEASVGQVDSSTTRSFSHRSFAKALAYGRLLRGKREFPSSKTRGATKAGSCFLGSILARTSPTKGQEPSSCGIPRLLCWNASFLQPPVGSLSLRGKI